MSSLLRPLQALRNGGNGKEKARPSISLRDAMRPLGCRIQAEKGWGKSLEGGNIGLADFERKIPQVILDPTGSLIDFFLGQLLHWAARLPPAAQQQLWA